MIRKFHLEKECDRSESATAASAMTNQGCVANSPFVLPAFTPFSSAGKTQKSTKEEEREGELSNDDDSFASRSRIRSNFDDDF